MYSTSGSIDGTARQRRGGTAEEERLGQEVDELFPVSSWIASKDQPGDSLQRRPALVMAPLEFLGLGSLEEVCVVGSGRDHRTGEKDGELALAVEWQGRFREYIYAFPANMGMALNHLPALLNFGMHQFVLYGQISQLFDLLRVVQPSVLLLLRFNKDVLGDRPSSFSHPLSIIFPSRSPSLLTQSEGEIFETLGFFRKTLFFVEDQLRFRSRLRAGGDTEDCPWSDGEGRLEEGG